MCFSLSEMKLLDILSSLMMDDTYKGRGKYHSKVRDTSTLTPGPLRLDSRDLREVPEVVLGRSQAFPGFLSGVCERLSIVLDGLKCFRGPLWGSRHL